MENTVYGKVHSIETFGAVDGPGVRYVVFLQGCPLKCLYCHNPDSWDCNGGKTMTSEEIVDNINLYKNFIKKGGVTISGGEPLNQIEFVLDIIKRCKKLEFHTAIDTAGSVPLIVSKPVIDNADMILLDIKALDPVLNEELTSRTNENTLDTLNYCEKIGRDVWIRHVLVPGYTLDNTLLANLADFLMGYSCVKKIELLPFHKMGEFKWEELGMEYKLHDTPAPTKDEIKEATDIFKSRGLPI